jgi:hypothetical protein
MPIIAMRRVETQQRKQHKRRSKKDSEKHGSALRSPLIARMVFTVFTATRTDEDLCA